MLTILSVEDNEGIVVGRETYYDGSKEVKLLSAKSLDEARALIQAHPEIMLALLDGEVDGGGVLPNTEVLIPLLLELGEIKIIACASHPDSNASLMSRGAHDTWKKEEIFTKIQALMFEQ